MLNRREAEGKIRQFQRFSRADLIYNSPSRPTGTIRTVNRDRLQNIPNLRLLQPRRDAFEDVLTDQGSELKRRGSSQGSGHLKEIDQGFKATLILEIYTV